jgi:hypothetical protein
LRFRFSTTKHDLPFISSAIHFSIALSPPFFTSSHWVRGEDRLTFDDSHLLDLGNPMGILREVEAVEDFACHRSDLLALAA